MNKKYTVPISDEVKEILLAGRIEGDCYYLPDRQLKRPLYLKVNKVLEALGGKWNRKKRGHIFESIPDIFKEIEDGEIVDEKKTYQVFETPVDLAKKIIAKASIKDGDDVLEPSAGRGAIARLITNPSRIECVEIQKKFCDEMANLGGFRHVECADFLTLTPDDFGQFDKIVMNPPFTGNQDIRHIRHAYGFLRSGGILVSICSPHPFFASDKESIAFREWLENVRGYATGNESGAFKSSGTLVNTSTVYIKRIE